MSKTMNRSMTSTIALLAALGLSTGLAQSAGTDTTEQNQTTTEAPAAPEASEDTASEEGTSTDATEDTASDATTEQDTDTATDDTATTDTDTATDDTGAATTDTDTATDDTATDTETGVASEEGEATEADGQIVMQEPDSVLLSDLMGAEVFTPAGDSLGEVADIVAAKDGAIQGVVIGVGGFLGIGQKQVAFAYDRIELLEVEGEPHFVLDTTVEEMEAAPEFKSAAAQQLEAEQEAMEQQQSTEPLPGAPTPTE
jgi:sporulation protein YlmC with PRC-barrel domain